MSEKNTVDQNEESTMKTWDDGTRTWRDSLGRYHRLDGPAYEGADGSKEWLIHDKRHRADGPAIERADGSKQWYVHGKFIVSVEPKENK